MRKDLIKLAIKKQTVLNKEMRDADMDLMDILAADGASKVFEKNTLVDYCYPTGISVIDYSLGYRVNVRDEDGNIIKQRLCLGLQAGSFNVLTGATQSFKTTIGMKIISYIAHSHNGNVIHLDAENRLSLERAKIITQLPYTWFNGKYPRYTIKQGSIGYDSIQEMVSEVYERKMKAREVLLKDTGEVDDQNQPIYLMPPTVIFCDSISDVIKKEYDLRNTKEWEQMKEMRSNTDGMQNAKTLKGVISDILPMMKEANIIFITIAHENANVGMSAFTTPKKQFQYGNKDVKISGGRALEYNASSVLSFTGLVKDDSRYHIDTDGFEGNTVLYEPTKVSTNESGNLKSGRGFEIVIDKRRNGVDNMRSLVRFLLDKGRLKGDKRGYRVLDEKGNELSNKFSWKNIEEDFNNDRETYKYFLMAAKSELDKLVAEAPDVSGKIRPFSIEMELGMLNDISTTEGVA